MGVALDKFRGWLPYASEMYGVFQPLIGWRSALTKARLAADPSGIPVLGGAADVTRAQGGFKVSLGRDYTVLVNTDGVIGQQEGRADLFLNPSPRRSHKSRKWSNVNPDDQGRTPVLENRERVCFSIRMQSVQESTA